MQNRLHPIYVALDSHQYAKAVKLASALPANYVLGQALLAYAYYKSGQSSIALTTTQALLAWNNSCATTVEGQDIVQRLEREPARIDWTNNASLIPSASCRKDFADETTLETIAITLQGLHQFEMVYQLYAWAGHYHPHIRLYTLNKQYAAGLQLLVRSTTNDSILASMQALTLQMARLSPSYTAWAARTALWQWQFSPTPADPSDLRYQMLPRLAESLVKKMIVQINDKCTIEDCFLAVEIYKSQAKWNDLLEILPTLVKLTPVQNLEIQATCWQELAQWEKAQHAYELLLEKQPGQWSYWKSLLHCCFQHGGLEHARAVSSEYTSKLQFERPTRSISLVSCECALMELTEERTSCASLKTAIQEYAETFSSQASCVFSDLEFHFDKFIEAATPAQVNELSVWAGAIRQKSIQSAGGEDRSKLRSLIFALQVLQKLNAAMPSWTEIAQEWKSFPITEGVQKENQPSDELILLAVDQVLKEPTPSVKDYLAAATLLEMGLRQSPFSPSLKLRLIGVYRLLHASDRCWALFRDLGMKHIQVDSCTYFIIPILLEGGLYKEALSVANETLKFHISTQSDSSDFVARSLENGTWSKADEFLCFQRYRMNRSMSLLESKGITMDCAPLLTPDVGLAHGIVGGDDDANRATRIMEEAHNWTGAPSLVSLKSEDLELLSDNRDLTILPLGMTAETKADVIRTALRRKLYHGILIRAAVVLEVVKAPRKGKITKTPEVLRLRCESLRKVLEEDEDRPICPWEQVTKNLAKVIVVVNLGLQETDTETDSLQSRENRATKLLIEALACIPDPNLQMSLNDVGKVIVDHLVSVIAITKMTAEVFLRFGWGKRKKRESVTSLASFAATLKASIVQMMTVAKSLDMDNLTPSQDDVLDDVICKGVCIQVLQSRKDTSARLLKILAVFHDELSTFEQVE